MSCSLDPHRSRGGWRACLIHCKEICFEVIEVCSRTRSDIAEPSFCQECTERTPLCMFQWQATSSVDSMSEHITCGCVEQVSHSKWREACACRRVSIECILLACTGSNKVISLGSRFLCNYLLYRWEPDFSFLINTTVLCHFPEAQTLS